MSRHLSYSQMRLFDAFEDRFDYLALGGAVGMDTFGHDRWMNQNFYTSREWKNVRRAVILRDNGCDLAVPGFDIAVDAVVHHMNPITPDHIIHEDDALFDLENLILVSHRTHNAIHYGDRFSLPTLAFPERTPHDTAPWRR